MNNPKESIVIAALAFGFCVAGHYAINKYNDNKAVAENVRRWHKKFED